MIDKHLLIQIDLFISIHDKPPELREGIDESGIRMELATLLHVLERDPSRSFHGVVVEGNLHETTIIRVKVGELSNHLVDHRFTEPERVPLGTGLLLEGGHAGEDGGGGGLPLLLHGVDVEGT